MAATATEKLTFEQGLWRSGKHHIAGVDEAGRGPLAGPVIAAAVILAPPHDCREMPLIDDSKRLSPAQREQAYAWITQHCVSWGLGRVDPEEIDRINIRQAAMLAMRKALAHLQPQPDHILVDGHALEAAPAPQTPLVKGDSRSWSIAAASILAKVERDRIMRAYHTAFPVYNFKQNKGYPTAEHIQAIIENGMCPLHRRSFRPKKLLELGMISP